MQWVWFSSLVAVCLLRFWLYEYMNTLTIQTGGEWSLVLPSLVLYNFDAFTNAGVQGF